MSVYYEEDGVHVYRELASDHPGLFLEYCDGSFTVNIPLSEQLSALFTDQKKTSDEELQLCQCFMALAKNSTELNNLREEFNSLLNRAGDNEHCAALNAFKDFKLGLLQLLRKYGVTIHPGWTEKTALLSLADLLDRQQNLLKAASHDINCKSLKKQHMPGYIHCETDSADESCPPTHFDYGKCDCWKATL